MRAASPDTARDAARPRRIWLRRLAWAGLALFLLLGAVLLWAWTQRYSLVERQLIDALEKRGIAAELRIDSATRTAAAVRDIELRHDGKRFLRVERLEAEYQWRDLLEGRIERLAVSGVDARLNVDATGRITDGWMPAGSGGGTVFPPRGVSVERGRVALETPYGPVTVSGDARLASLEDIRFDGRIEEARLSRDGAAASLSGPVEINRRGAELRIEAPGLDLSLSHPQGALRDTRAALSGTLDLTDGNAAGSLRLTGGSLSASAGLDATIRTVGLDGTLDADGGLRADAELSLGGVRVVEAARRAELARTLSLSGALSEVPIARNFAPQLVAPLQDLLGGSEVSGRVVVTADAAVRTLRLDAPLTLATPATQLTLTPVPDAPFYSYRRGGERYDVAATATLSRPIPLTLAPLRVGIRSSDGINVEAVASASGRARSRRDWTGRSPDGTPARLGPLDVAFDYANPAQGVPQLVLRGRADYDGDVPGGTVRGLDAGGTLTARLPDGRPSVGFAPQGPVRFAALDTVSEWGLRDFTGTLDPDGPVYARTSAGRARVATGLREARFTAERRPDAQGGPASLEMSVASAALTGTVGASTQDWDIAFETARLQSETFPVLGTDLSLPSGTVSVSLSESERTRFVFAAPDSVLVTPAYAVRGMVLRAEGTAERYELAYSGGRVRVVTAESTAPLPVLPATGLLRFADGVFTGEARSSLPRATDQPFDIAYRIVDGRGTADVTLRDLRFAPGALQPQDLVPALRGKISLVEGAIDADLDIAFGGGDAPTGTGVLYVKDMSLGTAPGPVSGLSGQVELTSLFPVVTAPGQTMRVALFDPGFPLRDGVFDYALVDGGIDVSRAVWPLGEGRVSIDPFTWRYAAPENRVTLRVTGVEVGEFLRNVGDGQLSATGELAGAIPVVVRGLDVLVEGGRVEVADGGYIRYRPKPGNDIAKRVPNRFAADALKALENFRYQSLFAEIDGPLGGEVKLGMQFTGTNEEVLYGVPFAFDVSVEGELFNIARSFNTNATIKRTVGTGVEVVQ